MKAMVVNKPHEPMQLMDVPIPTPTSTQVLVAVMTCGICHGDSLTISEGQATQYPIIPGHEVIGKIVELGSSVKGWTTNQIVGTGFHAAGNQIHGLTLNGGYAEYMVIEECDLVSIPYKKMEWALFSPLMCAGETTFSALKNSLAKPGETIAIQGIGGLGHLAIQYANKMGFNTVALSHNTSKQALVNQLGAQYFGGDLKETIVSLKEIGGAKVIFNTSSKNKLNNLLLSGLSEGGQLILVNGSDKDISSKKLISSRLSITGAYTSYAKSIHETVIFSINNGVWPIVEKYSLFEANEAYQHMMEGKTRFRAVLSIR